MHYQSKQQLIDLLTHLVEVPTITGSNAERIFPGVVEERLSKIDYFQKNPKHIMKHPTSDERAFLTALYKQNNSKKTIVMISHFDVVNVEDYGLFSEIAFSPKELSSAMLSQREEYSDEVKRDLDSGEWLFGRGTMDMKCGLALHMMMLEKAAKNSLNGNLLLLTVPDEEVNSVGMREAVPALLKLAEEHDLEFELILNSEPMFTQIPGDQNHYLYSGTIGKVMPAFLCYGQETHVGEPFSGLNANLMSSVITCEMELNNDYCERVFGQVSPPPTALLQKDLRKEYSVQIPHRAVSMYNLFLMKRSMKEVAEKVRMTAEDAARKIEDIYKKRRNQFYANDGDGFEVTVISFAELREIAIGKFGREYVQAKESDIYARMKGQDEREISISITDELAILCKELAPMIVTFFAPPYYPAVNSERDPLITKLTGEMMAASENLFSKKMQTLPYYNGISDLSYVSFQDSQEAIHLYEKNVPGWGEIYYLPFQEMKTLQVPVINVGPMGRDPHQKTERLNTTHAFEQLPFMLEKLVDTVFNS